MYMVTPATEATMMAVGHSTKIFDPRKNRLQLTDDSVTRLKDDFASNDPKVIFSYIPCQDDDMERLVEMCSLEMFLLQKREYERQSGPNAKLIPCCAMEILLSSVIVP